MTDKLVKTVFLDNQPVEIYERSQMVWLGSFMAPVVVECFYKLPAPNWPKVQIRSRRGIAKLWYKLGNHSGIMLDDDGFNAAYKVTSKNEEFAIMLLSPDLQSFIMDKPTVDWSVGQGSIKLWYKGKLKKKRIDNALDRLGRFHSLIAPELFDWD